MSREEQRKIVKFVVAGVGKTLGSYVVYLLLLWAGLHYNLALVGDYVFGILVGYLLSRSWIFTGQGRPRAGFSKYVVAYVLVFLINALALNVVVRLGADPAWGQIPCLALATIASYLLQRYWVFKGAA